MPIAILQQRLHAIAGFYAPQKVLSLGKFPFDLSFSLNWPQRTCSRGTLVASKPPTTTQRTNELNTNTYKLMNYNGHFKNLLGKLEDHETIGLGNPDSKILFVGKEAALDIDHSEDLQQIFQRLKDVHGSVKHWKSGKFDYTVNDTELKYLSDTWKNYQNLYANIDERERNRNSATFLKHVFTTEMSNLPSKTTNKAKRNPFFKEELSKRKQTFFTSEFIQNFPIVVLACSDYITNNSKIREIDEIFGVRYTGKSRDYSRGNRFYIHYNEAETKLVIHTRQLSADVNNELLEDMGTLIRTHLMKIELLKNDI